LETLFGVFNWGEWTLPENGQKPRQADLEFGSYSLSLGDDDDGDDTGMNGKEKFTLNSFVS